MDQQQRLRHELAFLWDQCAQAQFKIARAKNALDTAHSPLEEESLREMLRAAESERTLLDGLVSQHTSTTTPPSLEAVIMHQLDEARQVHESLIGVWRRGSPAPKGYWETETRYLLLTTLLLHYQNWMRVIPDGNGAVAGAKVSSRSADENQPNFDGYLRPWQPVGTNTGGETPDAVRQASSTDSTDPLIAIEDGIYAALDRAGIPKGFVEVVVESPDMVIVRGCARSRDERSLILAAVMTVEEVREVLSDVAVLPSGQQPAALFDRAQRAGQRRSTGDK